MSDEQDILPILRTILFTNSRDEHNIIEWIFYHKLLGFNKIVIYDHMSKTPVESFLSNKLFSDVEFIRIDDLPGSPKKELMKKAYQYAIKDPSLTHLLYIDMDEYVVLRKQRNINSFIEMVGRDLPGIALNWVCYGNNTLLRRTNNLIIDDFTYRIPWNRPHPDGYLPQLTKTIHRISALSGEVISPHYFSYTDPNVYNVNVLGMTSKNPAANTFLSERIIKTAYLAHFVYQSREDLFVRKLGRPRDDENTYRFPNVFLEPLPFFTLKDDTIKMRFAKKIKRAIRKYKLEDVQLALKTRWCPRLLEDSQLDTFITKSYDERKQILAGKAEEKILSFRRSKGHDGLIITPTDPIQGVASAAEAAEAAKVTEAPEVANKTKEEIKEIKSVKEVVQEIKEGSEIKEGQWIFISSVRSRMGPFRRRI